MTFQEELRLGIPDVLPEMPAYDTNINHAPKRKDILSPEEKRLALRNALRYFPKHMHAQLAVEFADELKKYESGESDIPMNFLCNAAGVLGVEPLELFAGDAPNMTSYWLVRKGKGPVIERQKARVKIRTEQRRIHRQSLFQKMYLRLSTAE